jgi:hypothetical protein
MGPATVVYWWQMDRRLDWVNVYPFHTIPYCIGPDIVLSSTVPATVVVCNQSRTVSYGLFSLSQTEPGLFLSSDVDHAKIPVTKHPSLTSCVSCCCYTNTFGLEKLPAPLSQSSSIMECLMEIVSLLPQRPMWLSGDILITLVMFKFFTSSSQSHGFMRFLFQIPRLRLTIQQHEWDLSSFFVLVNHKEPGLLHSGPLPRLRGAIVRWHYCPASAAKSHFFYITKNPALMHYLARQISHNFWRDLES